MQGGGGWDDSSIPEFLKELTIVHMGNGWPLLVDMLVYKYSFCLIMPNERGWGLKTIPNFFLCKFV